MNNTHNKPIQPTKAEMFDETPMDLRLDQGRFRERLKLYNIEDLRFMRAVIDRRLYQIEHIGQTNNCPI